MSKILVNELGRAVARSGLLPATADYFIRYLQAHIAGLKLLLPAVRLNKDGIPQDPPAGFDPLDIAFVVLHLCFSSPEFGGGDLPARRHIPYQIVKRNESERAIRLNEFLAVKPWDRGVPAVNAANLALDWMIGVPIMELEARYDKLRAGVLRDMYRTLVSHLTGLADIVVGMLTASDSGELPATFSWVAGQRAVLFRLVRRVRQMSRSVARGAPEDMLWLAELEDAMHRSLCRRPEVVAFHNRQIRTLEQVVDPGLKTILIEGLKDARSDPERWKIIREGAIQYRTARTERRQASQRRRISKACDATVTEYYLARNVPFEEVLERCFIELKIPILARDDDSKRGKAFPDFVVEINSCRVIIECKSCNGANDIALGEAADVFKKAGINNFNTEPLVTVCQPYVATDVPRKLELASRLSVVNAEDLAEALVRLHLKKLDVGRFLTWLTTPGQPRFEELSG